MIVNDNDNKLNHSILCFYADVKEITNSITFDTYNGAKIEYDPADFDLWHNRIQPVVCIS